MTDVMLEYYVPMERYNEKRIEMTNIFNNWVLRDAVVKEIKKYLRNKKGYKHVDYRPVTPITTYGFDAFKKEIRSLLQWQLYSRVQFEIMVTSFPFDKEELVKMDAYQLSEPNLDMICHDIIRQYREGIKEVK